MITGIDLGGTYIKGALFNKKRIIKRLKFKTPSGGKNICDAIIDLIYTLCPDPGYAGIGIPGMIYKGRVVQAPNLRGFEGFEIKKYLAKKLKFPFYIENDANCAALGEKYFGHGKNLKDFIVLTLGTGVGGGIFSGGKLLRGKDFLGGEIGHITVFPGGIKCGCGKKGCLEMYASKQGLKKILNRDIEPEEVAERAKKSIKKYIKVFETMGYALGIACGNLVNIFNPSAIIFSGGLSKSYDLFKKNFFKTLKNNAFPHLLKDLKIRVSELGDDTGVLGAISLIFYEKEPI